MDRPTITWTRKSSKMDKPLFHGTNLNFDIGQIILPANVAGVESNYDQFMDIPGRGRIDLLEGLSDHAFATTDVEEASQAAQRALERKGGPTARIYRVSPVDVSDVDIDPNSTEGIRSRTGFRVQSERMDNLRFDADGKSYFLHYSPNKMEVGDVIRASGSLQNDTGDALRGFSYGYDAFNHGAASGAVDMGHKVLSGQGSDQLHMYITSANAENVFPDLNVAANTRLEGTSERAIKRRTDSSRAFFIRSWRTSTIPNSANRINFTENESSIKDSRRKQFS
jgi:hypothetical protein